jgi:hypothetical protein
VKVALLESNLVAHGSTAASTCAPYAGNG